MERKSFHEILWLLSVPICMHYQMDIYSYTKYMLNKDIGNKYTRVPVTLSSYINTSQSYSGYSHGIPGTAIVAESDDGLLFSTVQVYSPPVVTVRVCVYRAVSGLSNTVTFPAVTVVESLVQVTVVAGPPVEIQVRVSWSESNVTSSPTIVMSPKTISKNHQLMFIIILHTDRT